MKSMEYEKSENQRRPMRVAIIGLGGFAGSHHKTLIELEKRGESVLVCTCDPQPHAFADQRAEWEFERRGVAVYANYLEMLDRHDKELDLVVIPTPIHLHFEMHQECIRRGLRVYLEKPPTLDYRELEKMIASEEDCRWKTQVGFNFIAQPERQALKQRFVDGEFGAVREVRLLGMWRRARSYFTRNNWAGRLRVGNRLVLDSVIGNAMSHYVHNCLFWGGVGGLFEWAPIATVEAKVYRTHAIEGGDTFFIRALATNGVRFRMALTHACTGGPVQHEHVIAEKGEMKCDSYRQFTVFRSDGGQETIDSEPRELVAENHRVYYAHCRDPKCRPSTLLSDCRPIVHLNDLVYISSGDIFSCRGDEHVDGEGNKWIELPGVEEAARGFLATGEFPSSRDYVWVDDRPPHPVTPDNLDELSGVVDLVLGANVS